MCTSAPNCLPRLCFVGDAPTSVLLIDIFSINRSRGYLNFCLGYYCNRALLCWRFPPQRGKWTLLSVIKVLFLVLFCYHFGIIMVLFWLYCCSSSIYSYLFMFCNFWNITLILLTPYHRPLEIDNFSWMQETFHQFQSTPIIDHWRFLYEN